LELQVIIVSEKLTPKFGQSVKDSQLAICHLYNAVEGTGSKEGRQINLH